MDPKRFKIPFPYRAAIHGPTGSGKSYLISEFLANHQTVTTSDKPLMVLYCWRGKEPEPIRGVNIKTYQGIPDIEDILAIERGGHCLTVVFDDLFENLSKLRQDTISEFIQLVTEYSRKLEIGLIITIQQVFPDSYFLRTFSRNLTFLVLFPFPSDEDATLRLIHRICPSRKRTILEGLYHANRFTKWSAYLFFSLHPHCNEPDIRIRTFLYPLENVTDNPVSPSRLFVLNSSSRWLKQAQLQPPNRQAQGTMLQMEKM